MKLYINLWRRGIVATSTLLLVVHDRLTNISNEETLLHDLLAIMKRMFQNY